MLLLLQPIQARSPTGFVALLLPATDLLLALSNATLAPGLETENHGATRWRGKKGRCIPSNRPCKPQLWRMVILYLLLTFQITSWSPSPFSWNPEKVVSSVDYPFLLGEGASQPDPSDLQIPSLFQLLENKSPIKTHFCRTVQTHSWTWEWLLLKLLRATMLRKWGREGWENPGETTHVAPPWAWLGTLQCNESSAPIKCLACKVSKKHLVNQSVN